MTISKSDEEINRKMRKEGHYSFLVTLPKKWMERLGWIMARDIRLVLKVDPDNPMNSEIILKVVDPETYP